MNKIMLKLKDFAKKNKEQVLALGIMMVLFTASPAFATTALDTAMGGLVSILLRVVFWVGILSLIIGTIFYFKNVEDAQNQTKYTYMMIFGVIAIIGKVFVQMILDAIGAGITL